MKRIAYLTVSILALTSCSNDFLDLVPPTSLSSASFYQTADQFDQATAAAYTNLRGIAFMGIYMDEMRSDNTFFTRYAADRGSFVSAEAYPEFRDNNTTSQSPNSPGNRYGNAYQGISKVNTILSRLENASLTAEEKNRISGEALFLRAFYYYDLVQHFGGVPLQLKEIVTTDEAFIPRSTVAEVYDQIVADLNAAIPLLPVAATFPQSGKATKGAAKMLLAYAYLAKPTKETEKATAELLDITEMNYGLMDNYADVFDPVHKNNKESIFEVQYKQGNEGQHSDFIWRFIPKATNPDFILGVNGTNARGGLASGGWNVPTQEMVDSYESGDLRLPASIAVAEGAVDDNNVMTITTVKSPVGFTPSTGVGYQYFIKKYLHPPFQVEFNTDNNWPVFRYAGALLLLAESLVTQGRNDEALPYINAVRRRANLAALTTVTAQDVADEMRHELAFENHRWMDLIRNGMAIETIQAKGERLKALYGWLLPNTFDINENKYIYAIPFREMQINNNLTQNPGYE
ncbi:membrane protein [Parapedobacter pyrenivorans]|uniref:Membrane protein n=1 Tax=Parapedobacter pyrenivorans TaxID=1305674 RepID=A0A917HCZ2_9SPHI|nr:RagB/SusD family nutrient uptake outer membrane protein [Parapedobacter pyrenivorans]GGG75331.1 membrane protein [Parapedobacter pyrenivorans]